MAAAPSPFASSKETTNYARLCRLLVEVGSQALRDTFDKKHPPWTLHGVLSTYESTLEPLYTSRIGKKEVQKVLNPTQWGKLYPVHSRVRSASFDITLLTVLLRNICGCSPPVAGWDNLPPSTDTSTAGDIARVKYYRNSVYGHASQASVDDASFNVYWHEIREALVRLGGTGFRGYIDNLKHDTMDPDLEKHYREVMKQWKKDDDSIKERLEEMEESIRDKLVQMKSEVRGEMKDKKERLDTLTASLEENKYEDMEDQKTDLLYRAGTDESPLFEVLNSAVWLFTDPRLYYPLNQNPLRRITRSTPVIYLWKTSISSIPDTLKKERHPNVKEIVLLKLQETSSKMDLEGKLKKILGSIKWTQTPVPPSYPRGMTRMNVSVLVHAVLEYLEGHRPTTPQESNFQAELKAASHWYWFKENERMQFVSRHFDDMQLKRVAKLALERWTKKLNEIKNEAQTLLSAKQGDSDENDSNGSIEDEISDLEEAIFSLRMYYGKALEEADDDSFGSGTLTPNQDCRSSKITEHVSSGKCPGRKRKALEKENTCRPAKSASQSLSRDHSLLPH